MPEISLSMLPQRASIARQQRARGSGSGFSETFAPPHATDVPCQVAQPRAERVEVADAYQVEYMQPIVFRTGADVRQHDRVSITNSPVAEHVGKMYQVVHEVFSSAAGYVKCECRRVERA